MKWHQLKVLKLKMIAQSLEFLPLKIECPASFSASTLVPSKTKLNPIQFIQENERPDTFFTNHHDIIMCTFRGAGSPA